MNPYGYLSGELYYNMPFFLGLLLVNVLAIVVWGLLLAKHWEEVLPVQATPRSHTGQGAQRARQPAWLRRVPCTLWALHVGWC